MTASGEVQRYFREVVLPYDGDECLIWPYARTRGYARMRINGRKGIAHRHLCELLNGPAPSPDHQAAHSCGNGHLGCVTGRHLSWKLRKDNTLDAIETGRFKLGQMMANAVLTDEQAKFIFDHKGIIPNKELASMFGIGRSKVTAILG